VNFQEGIAEREYYDFVMKQDYFGEKFCRFGILLYGNGVNLDCFAVKFCGNAANLCNFTVNFSGNTIKFCNFGVKL